MNEKNVTDLKIELIENRSNLIFQIIRMIAELFFFCAFLFIIVELGYYATENSSNIGNLNLLATIVRKSSDSTIIDIEIIFSILLEVYLLVSLIFRIIKIIKISIRNSYIKKSII